MTLIVNEFDVEYSSLMVPLFLSGDEGKSGTASLYLDPFLHGSPKDGRWRRDKSRRPYLEDSYLFCLLDLYLLKE